MRRAHFLKTLNSQEQGALFEVISALGASLDFHEAWANASPWLMRIVPADSSALAVTQGIHPNDYEWMVTNLPPTFLSHYNKIAPHDFIRASVIRSPNIVMSDTEMLDRKTIEGGILYNYARDLGAPIEQAMAVMLHVDRRWESGLSLYRNRRRPFAKREREILQTLTPAIANTVRNIRRFGELSRHASLLEIFLGRQGFANVVVNSACIEVGRTTQATAIIERWFPPVERNAYGLPWILLDELKQAMTDSPIQLAAAKTLIMQRDSLELHITWFPLSISTGESLWALEFREVSSHTSAHTRMLSKLTPRQKEVAERLAYGSLSYKQIADELSICEGTMRTHAEHIYRQLNVHSRAELVTLLR